MRRQFLKWITTRLHFIPSSLSICAFPAVPLNISLMIRSTNDSRLFSESRRSSVTRKLYWQSVVKWIEPNCALKIIAFYLSNLSFFFFFNFHHSLLHSYFIIIFLSLTFLGTHVRTGSYALTCTPPISPQYLQPGSISLSFDRLIVNSLFLSLHYVKCIT